MSKHIRNKHMEELLAKYPKAHEVKHKYKAIAAVLQKTHPPLHEIPIDRLEEYIFDAISLDREWRKQTEGEDEENKEILSQQWKIDNGYLP